MRLIFAGTPANAAQALEIVAANHEVALVITRPDAPTGRKRLLTPSPVAVVASNLDLPVLKTARIGPQELELIGKSSAELALVVAYGAMIPAAALNLLPWWNLHFSMLPMWRGATPLQHSILHGGVGAGVTLFKLDTGLDTGLIVAQKPIQLGVNESTAEALPRFTAIGMELFQNAVAQEEVSLEPQVGPTSYAPKLVREEARLDLVRTAQQLHQAVLAFNPEPMAWLECDGSPLRIIESRSLGDTDWVGAGYAPGRITKSGDKVLLEAGSGTQLELIKVQPAGKNVMLAGDWYRGQSSEVFLG
ncbi:MAG: hypothetical protein RL068_1133 [Actinomycetota bacterium]|jgi:methionyl-tRNA formyltransferase